ncbi:hypothetical protein QTV49_001856 [Vibrio vulnificus]|nr:hypothetical protein [Vibrio vulnificus]
MTFSMSRGARFAIAAVAFLALSPLTIKSAMKTEVANLERKKSALEFTSKLRADLLHPSDEKYNDMKISAHYHNLFRRNSGIVIDWSEGENFGIGKSMKDRLAKQIESDSKGISALMVFALTAQSAKGDSTNLTAHTYNNNSHQIGEIRKYAEFASPEVAILLSNPIEFAIALNNGGRYKGIRPLDYTFNSPKLTRAENIRKTIKYHERYREYWLGFIFDDEFFDAPIYDRKIFTNMSNK